MMTGQFRSHFEYFGIELSLWIRKNPISKVNLNDDGIFYLSTAMLTHVKCVNFILSIVSFGIFRYFFSSFFNIIDVWFEKKILISFLGRKFYLYDKTRRFAILLVIWQ